MDLIDFSNCQSVLRFYGGSEQKKSIIYNKFYI